MNHTHQYPYNTGMNFKKKKFDITFKGNRKNY